MPRKYSMIFSQAIYFVLLSISVLAFFIAPKNWRKLTLTISGVFFYTYFAGSFTWLIVAEILIVYFLLQHRRGLRSFVALAASVSILTYFKYRGLFTVTFNQLSDFVNLGLKLPVTTFAIPLAVSFFTFEFVHLVVERRRGSVKVIRLLDLSAFIFFFPTLVAGPIKRFHQFNGQVFKARPRSENAFFGGVRIITGMFKKIVIADTFSSIAGSTLLSRESVLGSSTIGLWLSLVSYSLRIYFDFSGYSDIAIGSARLFDITIPENFIFPYLRTNIATFWKNWHRTLYRWVIDYIFIPLGGSRKGTLIAIRNTFITFAISGLWHGAAWRFFIWGLYHGLLLSIYRLYKLLDFKIRVKQLAPVSKVLSTTTTFILVSVGWLFFIAPVDVAAIAIAKMFNLLP